MVTPSVRREELNTKAREAHLTRLRAVDDERQQSREAMAAEEEVKREKAAARAAKIEERRAREARRAAKKAERLANRPKGTRKSRKKSDRKDVGGSLLSQEYVDDEDLVLSDYSDISGLDEADE